jgi:hypothetical protein
MSLSRRRRFWWLRRYPNADATPAGIQIAPDGDTLVSFHLGALFVGLISGMDIGEQGLGATDENHDHTAEPAHYGDPMLRIAQPLP